MITGYWILSFRIPVFILILLLSFLSLAQASILERMKKPDSFFLQKSIVNLITPQILKKELNNFLNPLTYPGRSHQNLGHKKINNFFDKVWPRKWDNYRSPTF